MQKILIAVCEEESGYLERLSEYLLEKKEDSVEIYTFTEKEAFLEELKKRRFHAALMGESFWGEELAAGELTRTEQTRAEQAGKEQAGKEQTGKEQTEGRLPGTGMTRFIFLSEGAVPKQWQDYPSIYKYQSADNILREIYGILGEAGTEKIARNSSKEIIGVYSPHQHELQMLFSMTLAGLLAEQEKVLYLNFMDCAGLTEIYGEEYEQDIGDLLYLAKNSGAGFAMKLQSMVHTTGKLSYVPPATNPENLHEAGEKDYDRLFLLLLEKTDYDVFVVDFGSMIPGFYNHLNHCDVVYCPIKEGFLYQCRVKQFESCLTLEGQQNLLHKIRYLPFSMDIAEITGEEELKQQMFWGELGDFVRAKILGTKEQSL